jgi:S-adenosylmethionine hydrolase
MLDPHITLTTDFGEESPYVAAMKGVILAINPTARLLDLTHQIAPQNLRHAAYFLKESIPYFPAEAIHLVVVDPGVGTERALLYVDTGEHRLVVPDNGCWTPLVPPGARPQVRRLAEPRFWRQPVSSTFHGRDILAPVAAALSRGTAPEVLGPVVDDWVRLILPAPHQNADTWDGEVLFVDHFGNLITNIPGSAVFRDDARTAEVEVDGRPVPRLARTYGEAPAGTLVALVGSAETLEIAVTQGSAARMLGAGAGTPARVIVRN